MSKLTLDTLLILLIPGSILAFWGCVYAKRIYKRPMLRTYFSVALGTGIPLSLASYAFWHCLWIRGYFWELWWLAFIFSGAIVIPAIPMMYLQEKKFQEQIKS